MINGRINAAVNVNHSPGNITYFMFIIYTLGDIIGTTLVLTTERESHVRMMHELCDKCFHVLRSLLGGGLDE